MSKLSGKALVASCMCAVLLLSNDFSASPWQVSP